MTFKQWYKKFAESDDFERPFIDNLEQAFNAGIEYCKIDNQKLKELDKKMTATRFNSMTGPKINRIAQILLQDIQHSDIKILDFCKKEGFSTQLFYMALSTIKAPIWEDDGIVGLLT